MVVLLVTVMFDLPPLLKFVLLLAALGAAIVNHAEMILRTPRSAPVAGNRRLRLAFANVLRSNSDAARLIDWVRREKVDVLVVAEAVGTWPDRLAVLADDLPFVAETRLGDVASIRATPSRTNRTTSLPTSDMPLPSSRRHHVGGRTHCRARRSRFEQGL